MKNLFVKKKKPCTEHHSFWLQPETMRYIRNASNVSRIPQGQILQIIVDFYRLSRIKLERELTSDESARLDNVRYFSRILPL